MAYNWVPLTQDFDRSLVIKKWRFDVDNAFTDNYDCALAESPNIAVEGYWGPATSGPEFGYAFENRFNVGARYFTNRYYGFTDGYWTATTETHTQLVSGSVYEFVCPVDMYFAGTYQSEWDPELANCCWFYVDTGSISVDTTDIAAESGGSAYTVSVSADTGTSWTAATSASWVTITSATGEGNGSFVVTVAENDTYEPRDTVVELSSSDGDLITITVTQVKNPVLIERHQIYRSGNMVNKMYRSGELIYQNIYEPAPEPEPEYSAMPLTFQILSGGNITYTHNGSLHKPFYYRKNGGNWVLIENRNTGTTTINVVEGDIVEFKGNNNTYAQSYSIYDTFSGSTATFNAYGNIMSLVYGDVITGGTSLSAYAFYDLFAHTRITSAENLILPAQTLGSYSYGGLFEGCTALTTGPELPANSIQSTSYGFMFMGCRNLTYIKCTVPTAVGQQSWVQGVGATGTFVKHPDANWTTGQDGIPNNWTVQDATI